MNSVHSKNKNTAYKIKVHLLVVNIFQKSK